MASSLNVLQAAGEDDRLGNVLLGLPALTTLPLDGEVGLLFCYPELALEKSFRTMHDLPRFQPLGQLDIFNFQSRHLDFGNDQEADHRDEPYLAAAVVTRLPVLDVDDSHPSP